MFLEDSKWWTVRYKNGKNPFMSPRTCPTFVFPFILLCFYFCHVFKITVPLFFLWFIRTKWSACHWACQPSPWKQDTYCRFSNEKEDKRFCPFLSCTFWHMWPSWLEQFTFFIVHKNPKLWLSDQTSDRSDSAEIHFATYHLGALELKLL